MTNTQKHIILALKDGARNLTHLDNNLRKRGVVMSAVDTSADLAYLREWLLVTYTSEGKIELTAYGAICADAIRFIER